MPEEKTTAEQILHDANYHGRNLTLREFAFANFLRRPLGKDVDLTAFRLKSIDGGKIVLGPPYNYSYNVIVAVGENGEGQISLKEGEFFERASMGGGFVGNYNDVRVKNNTAIAVGTSEEIQKWNGLFSEQFTQKNTGGTETLRAVDFGNGVWLAVGDDGKILKSINNGETWVDKTVGGGSGPDFIGVRYGNGRWVLIGEEGEFYYSTDDGESWTSGNLPLPSTLVAIEEMFGVIFDGNQFVAYGKAEDSLTFSFCYLATSLNGNNWTGKDVLRTTQNNPLPYGVAPDGGATYLNGVHLLSCGDKQLLFSYDNCETWWARANPVNTSGELKAATGISGAFFLAGKTSGSASEVQVYRSEKLY